MSRILFFSGDITRNGGTERVACHIANALATDNEVLFLSLTEQAKEPFFALSEKIKRMKLGDTWKEPGMGYISYLPKLRKIIKTIKPDVIIDIDIVLDVLTVPAAMGLPVKIISWEHFNLEYEQNIRYRKMIVKHFTDRTDAIVTLTPGDCRDYQNLMGRQERIYYIYNPVERAETDAAEREKIILTVGGLIPRKGMDYLAQTAVQVLKKHTDWKWILLGEGDERAFLERTARENGIEDRLILEGQVTEVDTFYRRASIYVCTSRQEGLPMAMLEAMGHGLPLVSFDIPTGPSVLIAEEENGYLIKPFDCEAMGCAINKLIENDTLREAMGRESMVVSEPFDKEAVVARWRALIRDVIAG